MQSCFQKQIYIYIAPTSKGLNRVGQKDTDQATKIVVKHGSQITYKHFSVICYNQQVSDLTYVRFFREYFKPDIGLKDKVDITASTDLAHGQQYHFRDVDIYLKRHEDPILRAFAVSALD